MLPVHNPQGLIGRRGVDGDVSERQDRFGSGTLPEKQRAHREATPDAVEEFENVAGIPPEAALEPRHTESPVARERHEFANPHYSRGWAREARSRHVPHRVAGSEDRPDASAPERADEGRSSSASEAKTISCRRADGNRIRLDFG